MKIASYLLISLALVMSIVYSMSAEDPAKEIQSALDQQMQAWNNGNIEGYMKYYWNSEKLTFQSGDKRMMGWKTLLEMYKTKYSGENMGKLEFSDIVINKISSDYAYILGRWKVIRKDTKEGVFTLIMKRLPDGWRIIHDHSS